MVKISVASIAHADRAVEVAKPDLIITAYCGSRIDVVPTSLHLPISDVVSPSSTLPCRSIDLGDLELVCEAIHGVMSEDPSILFMCLAGLSRSPALALFAAEWLASAGASAWTAMKAEIAFVAPNPDILDVGAQHLARATALRSIRDEVRARPRPANATSREVFSFAC